MRHDQHRVGPLGPELRLDQSPMIAAGVKPKTKRVVFGRRLSPRHRAVTVFSMAVRWNVKLSGLKVLKSRVDGADSSDLRVVGDTTVNAVKNFGSQPWTPSSAAIASMR
jgi:hypothetical protein